MKTKLFILSCLMVCSSFFYQGYARPLVSTNLKFIYTGPSSFPDDRWYRVTTAFEGSDWKYCLGARVYIVFSKTPDFDLTNPSKVFYRCAMGRSPSPECSGWVGRDITYKITVSNSMGDYNIKMDNKETIPDGEYYVAALITAYYKSEHSYVLVREKTNRKVYIGNKPAPTGDIEVSAFNARVGRASTNGFYNIKGDITLKFSSASASSTTVYLKANILNSSGSIVTTASLWPTPYHTVRNGQTLKVSTDFGDFIGSNIDNGYYKTIEIVAVNDCNTCCTESNLSNNSKKVALASSSRSLQIEPTSGYNINQNNIANISAIWDNYEQSAIKVTVDEEWIGKEIYIVNVTRNTFVAKQKITAAEFSVSVANAVKKGDLIGIYIDGTEQTAKLLKTN